MKTVRRQVSKQQETLAVVAVAVVVVLLYTLWGASVLRAEKQSAVADTQTQLAVR